LSEACRAANSLSRDENGFESSRLSIFEEHWWIDAAQGRVALVHDKGGRVIGRFGYAVRRNKLGMRLGVNLPWSHQGGPRVADGIPVERRAEVYRELLAALPRGMSYHFVVQHDAIDRQIIVEEFERIGATHRSELNLLRPPEAPSVDLIIDQDKNLRHARNRLEIVDIGASDFLSFYWQNLAAAKLVSSAPLSIAQALIEAAQRRNKIRIIAARKKAPSGVVQPAGPPPFDAALAYVWDDDTAAQKGSVYNWLMTRRRSQPGDPDRPHGEATKLLVLRAMSDAQLSGRVFNADGTVVDGMKAFYASVVKHAIRADRDIFTYVTPAMRLYKRQRDRIIRYFRSGHDERLRDGYPPLLD
jgi:hypothetical protein